MKSWTTNTISLIIFIHILNVYTLLNTILNTHHSNFSPKIKRKTPDHQIGTSFRKQLNDHIIEGEIQLNGLKYTVQCKCPTNRNLPSPENKGESILVSKKDPQCSPSKIKIKNNLVGNGASSDDIRNLVGELELIEFVRVEDHNFQCMDGRNYMKGLSTPGGDAGEFILALSVYEDLVQGEYKLDQKKVDKIFESYVDKMTPKKFTMCIDEMAVDHIEKSNYVSVQII